MAADEVALGAVVVGAAAVPDDAPVTEIWAGPLPKYWPVVINWRPSVLPARRRKATIYEFSFSTNC